MPANDKHVPGVQYVAGRSFLSLLGEHQAGDIIEDAQKLPNIDVLVSAGFLYPFAPDEGYDWLPAHLYNDVMSYEQAMAKLTGDPTVVDTTPFPKGKPRVVTEAEAQAEMQNELYDRIKDSAAPAKKAAAKKAAPKKEESNG